MASDVEGSDLTWLEEELQVLSVKSDVIDPKGKPTLLGTVYTDRFYRRDGLKAFLRSVWKTSAKFSIDDVGQNLFLFRFESDDDLTLVMTGGPWVFCKQWLLLSPLYAPIERRAVRIFDSPVWLRVMDIPPGSDKDDLVLKVGGTFGGVVDYEIEKGYCKVKVVLDVRNPLRRGVVIAVEDDPKHVVRFKYESLPVFCYGCGRVGHDLAGCSFVSEAQKQKPENKQPYTSALRAGSEVMGRLPELEDRSAGRGKQRNYAGDVGEVRSRFGSVDVRARGWVLVTLTEFWQFHWAGWVLVIRLYGMKWRLAC